MSEPQPPASSNDRPSPPTGDASQQHPAPPHYSAQPQPQHPAQPQPHNPTQPQPARAQYPAQPQFSGQPQYPGQPSQYPTQAQHPGQPPQFSGQAQHPGQPYGAPAQQPGQPYPSAQSGQETRSPLGRVAFTVALASLAIGLIATISFPFLFRAVDYDAVTYGAITAVENGLVLIVAIAALILGIIAARRPGRQVLAGIAIGISASQIAAIVFGWLSGLAANLSYGVGF